MRLHNMFPNRFRNEFYLLVLSLFAAPQALAETVGEENFYVGGGVVVNSLDRFDDATGFQVFGGLELPFVFANARHSMEIGFMDTGKFEVSSGAFGAPVVNSGDSASGAWASYNLGWSIYDDVSLFARAGYDVGDDDGVLIGGGAEFDLSEPVRLRLEFVKRNEIDSLQLNLTYHFRAR